MILTGKYITVDYDGIHYQLPNQRCRDWTHPYEWARDGSTLSTAGCGIFSIANAAQYLGGAPVIPEELADFACRAGGRDDTGTDRPALLSAMEKEGAAAKHGFCYRMDGLRNDLDTLHDHLLQGNAALCNLRVGHIVALIGARQIRGEKQVLAADPFSESADPRVRDAVRECVPGSEVRSAIVNEKGLPCGVLQSFALYWAALSAVKDFNLLYRLRK